MPSQRETSPLESSSTLTMPPQSFQETRNKLVSRLITVYHRLRYQKLPLTTVGEYLLEITDAMSILQQTANTEVHPSDKQTHDCCMHRLIRIQTQLREQAFLLQGYPQDKTYQKCLAAFYNAVEMIAVQIGRCILKSHPD